MEFFKVFLPISIIFLIGYLTGSNYLENRIFPKLFPKRAHQLYPEFFDENGEQIYCVHCNLYKSL